MVNGCSSPLMINTTITTLAVVSVTVRTVTLTTASLYPLLLKP